MTKGEQTRREIVRKAAPLFNQKGFEGTSLADLMDATGLQKGGIYRHFSSKEELAVEAFDYAWQKAVSGRLDGLDRLPDAVDRLKKLVENFVLRRSGLVPGGCPLLNAAVEADDGNPRLRERARKALRSWTARLSRVISDGIRKREIRRGIEPLKLSQRIIGSLEGALLISRLTASDAPLREVREQLDEYLEADVRAARARARRASANFN